MNETTTVAARRVPMLTQIVDYKRAAIEMSEWQEAYRLKLISEQSHERTAIVDVFISLIFKNSLISVNTTITLLEYYVLIIQCKRN